MRIIEYRLPVSIYGKNAPALCYAREQSRYRLFDDTAAARIEISQVFYGDGGWTFAGLIQANILDKFDTAKQAMFTAFSRYAESAREKLAQQK